MMKSRIVILIGLFLYGTMSINAQSDEPIEVPDISGMTVPVAAAFLNDLGLQIGPETAVGWTNESAVEPNTIVEQAIAPGEPAAYGTVIDITVARAPNVVLIYDDNDITLVNQADGPIALGGVRFFTNGGSPQAAFQASRWDPTVGAGSCTQLWSVGRTAAKDVTECASGSVRWMTTNNTAEHFWTGANGATTFTVVQDGIERAVCNVSATGRCEFYLSAASSGEIAPYIYMVYKENIFMIMNNTTDQWMSLTDTTVDSNFAAEGTQIVDVSFFSDPVNIVGYIEFLAPGQCIIYTNNADGAAPLQPCKEIARASFNTAPTLFWNADFNVSSIVDDLDHTCSAGLPDRMTICILPR